MQLLKHHGQYVTNSHFNDNSRTLWPCYKLIGFVKFLIILTTVCGKETNLFLKNLTYPSPYTGFSKKKCDCENIGILNLFISVLYICLRDKKKVPLTLFWGDTLTK